MTNHLKSQGFFKVLLGTWGMSVKHYNKSQVNIFNAFLLKNVIENIIEHAIDDMMWTIDYTGLIVIEYAIDEVIDESIFKAIQVAET